MRSGQSGDEASPNEQGELATLPPAEQAEQQTEGGTIVVTGSRLRRTEFTSPDPIQVINPQLGAREGKNQTVDLINSSPIAAGSTQITGAISTNFVTNGGEGAQTVSLRGLGAERTLILLNSGDWARPAFAAPSRRSTSTPFLRLSQLDRDPQDRRIVVYGSDAIAGVVNILTKRSTEGIELRGFTSVPEDGAGETYNVSATWGKEFERGHIIVTADYFRQNDLKRNDRKFLDCNEEFLRFTDGRRADIADARTGQPACNGVLGNSIITGQFDFTGPGFSQGLLAPNGQQLFVSQFAVGNEWDGVCLPSTTSGCRSSRPTQFLRV